SDPDKPALFSSVSIGEQPNMMHLTGDGKRMYVTNSLLSTTDRSGDFWVRLIRVDEKGMTIDPKFNVDLTKFPTGAARGHDMLLTWGGPADDRRSERRPRPLPLRPARGHRPCSRGRADRRAGPAVPAVGPEGPGGGRELHLHVLQRHLPAHDSGHGPRPI